MSGLVFSSSSQSYNAGDAAIVLDANLDLDFNTSNNEQFGGATVQITNVQAGDVLGFTIPTGLAPNVETALSGLGYAPGDFLTVDQVNAALTALNADTSAIIGFPATLSYDSNTGVLTIDGDTSIENYERALQLVSFQNSNSDADATAREISFSLEALGLDSGNGRFYQFVNNPGISWMDARDAAQTLTNFGRQGYLATITSQEEQDLIRNDINGNGWIGGSDAATEGEWRWVTGPEGAANNGNGTLFWSGNGTAGQPVDGAYHNWRRVENPDDPNDINQLEPNDNNGIEDYAHVIGNAIAGEIGKWNDLQNNETLDGYQSNGYLVEFGGSEGDPELSFTGNITLNVSSTVDTVDTPDIPVTSPNWEVKAVEDFGADSKADILWYNNSTGEVALWQMDGTTEVSQTVIDTVPPSTNWMIMDAGDTNGDNQADILWYNNVTGEVGLWEMNGDNAVTKDVIGVTVDPSLGWEIVQMADVDGDKNDDIIWRNGITGENGVWRLNGFEVVEYKTIHTVADTNWEIVGAADMNGDTKDDLIWRNTGNTAGNFSENNAIWLMDGTEVSGYSYIPSVTSTDWMIAGADDFNGDGKADIAWRNGVNGEDAIWSMDGVNVSSYDYIDSVTDTDWNIVGTGDFGGDGNADFMWRNQNTFSPSNNAIWQMNGASILNQSFIDPA